MQVFDDVAASNVVPDMIVISGDLIHGGKASDYRHFESLVEQQQERFGVSIQVVLGNHDRTQAFYEGYLEEKPQPRYYYTISDGGWDFYFLDTKCGDLEPGYLDTQQLNWLDHNLNQSSKPAVIFMHHPMLGAPLENMKYSILQNSDALHQVLDGKNVKAIFSGHVHFPNLFLQNGILNVTADSTAYHINCANPKQHLISEGTSYNIINLSEESISVEQRPLLLGNTIIKTFNIPRTDFVDPSIINKEMRQVLQ
ncbi:metallophosphoesterase [Lentilactobacillus otakiensis DSM 19908 = JCM 15040]|uniref:Metallophosphoesterase n=2 Tax=Lentilactobacillus otakiensis TaxID=481720 RepID=S4NC05_9LACO|nr:metallophosphoesterase [Lentilactobacillus otakiensis DSM 19908 = JCM 15040]